MLKNVFVLIFLKNIFDRKNALKSLQVFFILNKYVGVLKTEFFLLAPVSSLYECYKMIISYKHVQPTEWDNMGTWVINVCSGKFDP